jgi:hypothetical protein
MATKEENNKSRLKFRTTGRLGLENKFHDIALTLLAEGVAQEEILDRLPEITALELEAVLQSPQGQVRLEFLKAKQVANLTKRVKPKSNDDYMAYALSRLHTLSEKAVEDKDKVAASHKLGQLAHLFKKDKVNQPETPANFGEYLDETENAEAPE